MRPDALSKNNAGQAAWMKLNMQNYSLMYTYKMLYVYTSILANVHIYKQKCVEKLAYEENI